MLLSTHCSSCLFKYFFLLQLKFHLAFLVFRIIGTDPRLCYIVLRSCIYQPHSLISDIYRRIYISIMMGFALWTIPLSYRKIFLFCIFVTINRTGLAACKKSIHLHKFLTLFLQYIFYIIVPHFNDFGSSTPK